MAQGSVEATERKLAAALRKWLELPEPNAQAAVELLKGLLLDQEPIFRAKVCFSELNCVLFKRCVEAEWPAERALEHPALGIGASWLRAAPTDEIRAKLCAGLRKRCFAAMDAWSEDAPMGESQAIRVLRLLEVIIDVRNVVDEFALTFLKVQRFCADSSGRLLRSTSPFLNFECIRILFQHAQRALFDPNPLLMAFFETHPRWFDLDEIDPEGGEALRTRIILFLRDHVAKSSQAVILKVRRDLFRAFVLEDSSITADRGFPPAQEAILDLVEKVMAVKTSTPVDLTLEALSEDPLRGRLVSAVLSGFKRLNDADYVACFAALVRCELDGYVPRIPLECLVEFQVLTTRAKCLDLLEEGEIFAEWSSALLSLSEETGATMMWFLGEAGSSRGWRSAFDALRGALFVVDLPLKQLVACVQGLSKFAASTKHLVDYRGLVVEALRESCQARSRLGLSSMTLAKGEAIRLRALASILHV